MFYFHHFCLIIFSVFIASSSPAPPSHSAMRFAFSFSTRHPQPQSQPACSPHFIKNIISSFTASTFSLEINSCLTQDKGCRSSEEKGRDAASWATQRQRKAGPRPGPHGTDALSSGVGAGELSMCACRASGAGWCLPGSEKGIRAKVWGHGPSTKRKVRFTLREGCTHVRLQQTKLKDTLGQITGSLDHPVKAPPQVLLSAASRASHLGRGVLFPSMEAPIQILSLNLEKKHLMNLLPLKDQQMVTVLEKS